MSSRRRGWNGQGWDLSQRWMEVVNGNGIPLWCSFLGCTILSDQCIAALLHFSQLVTVLQKKDLKKDEYLAIPQISQAQ